MEGWESQSGLSIFWEIAGLPGECICRGCEGKGVQGCFALLADLS